ncbi:hypothetical protein QN360_16775 [Glaciimonas sp. CA11.2]|uniref:hypothetical protein n=1 Tax=unclassified Glaciimonas TaxID=2644401 RepID=UPI002AB49CEA|nr:MULTISPECIES: hypothetical protein [unclassified Glaciimonas]MDY7548802.1 hypothetical protein [Glaciimonas sp. CA11.2]MEB0012449.1 hypothetical protein [Glaciimonas sp. Cout2]MEB0082622.1 hypothetical protein [Glaciimonas sp. Gout2]MEB0164550.1 hypothetical protein [Glaciimonas sp. CA11.2]
MSSNNSRLTAEILGSVHDGVRQGQLQEQPQRQRWLRLQGQRQRQLWLRLQGQTQLQLQLQLWLRLQRPL